MITKVEISNYRSCRECEFDLQPRLSVLIGPNGSGKTNVLNCILLLNKLTMEERGYSPEGEELAGTSKLKVHFKLGDKKGILNARIRIYTDEYNRDRVITSQQRWYLKDFTGNAKRVNLPLAMAGNFARRRYGKDELLLYRTYHRSSMRYSLGNEPALKAIEGFAKFTSGMRYYSASQFTNPSNCPVSIEIEKEGRKSRGVRLRGHAKFLYDLYRAWKYKSHGYKEFFEIIGPAGIGLIDDITFKEIEISSMDVSVRSGGRVEKRTRKKMLVVPQFAVAKNELSPNQLSEGTFKTITLLFYLVTEESSMLLIEEPEVCVHHGLLSSILELIKTYSRDKQIVLSTHSDFVLDHVSPENVYTVSNELGNGTRVRHVPKSMSRREFAALREYLRTEGNLGEYWKHGALES